MVTSVEDTNLSSVTSVSNLKDISLDLVSTSRWDSAQVSILIIITVLGVLLNTCTITLLWKIRCLPNIMNAVVLNMAFVDLCTCLYLPYHVTTILHADWFTNRSGCLPGHIVMQLKSTLTVSLLVYMAVDQCVLAYGRGDTYRHWTKRTKSYTIITMIWLLSLTISIAVPLISVHKVSRKFDRPCSDEQLLKHNYLYAMLLYVTIHIIVALLLLLFVATKYACCRPFKPNLHVEQRRDSPVGLFNESRTKNAQRVYILCVILTVVFTTLVAVHLLASLFNLVLHRTSGTTHTDEAGVLLLALHTCCSPILYIARLSSVRRAYCRMLRGDCGGGRHSLARTTDSVQLYGMSFTTHVTGVVLNLQARIRNRKASVKRTRNVTVTRDNDVIGNGTANGSGTLQTDDLDQKCSLHDISSNQKESPGCADGLITEGGAGSVWCTAGASELTNSEANNSNDKSYSFKHKKRDSLQEPVTDYF